MPENRLTQIVGQALYTNDSTIHLTQIVGQALYDETVPNNPPAQFKPGGFGVQIID